MYCPHCGKEISDDSKFCRYCGKDVETKKEGESLLNKENNNTNIIYSIIEEIKGIDFNKKESVYSLIIKVYMILTIGIAFLPFYTLNGKSRSIYTICKMLKYMYEKYYDDEDIIASRIVAAIPLIFGIIIGIMALYTIIQYLKKDEAAMRLTVRPMLSKCLIFANIDMIIMFFLALMINNEDSMIYGAFEWVYDSVSCHFNIWGFLVIAVGVFSLFVALPFLQNKD